jgi:hypothetical protein
MTPPNPKDPREQDAPASRYIDTIDDIQIDPATLPQNVKLLKELQELEEDGNDE